ncbi:histone-lysine N-methyltransferase [Plakobranchus ocellatus]|uniref:Histone-lysine N-methyltransferase n=1 Tax=Plakobranchus ocellatus TaxID=259542 RepID=A0AAV4AM49_9GAST|nr:histone-lysine N-methyltransferase [Plakobranchus ocellatus]
MSRVVTGLKLFACICVAYSCTRIYWSTQDARRRCVYTCRIVEVKPSDLDSPGAHIQDMRVVHDPDHPDFVPLEQLNLENSGVPNFMKLKSEPESYVGVEENSISFGSCLTNKKEMIISSSITSLHSINSSLTTHITTTCLVSAQTASVPSIGTRNQRASSWSHFGDYGSNSSDYFVVDPANPHGGEDQSISAENKVKTVSSPPAPKPQKQASTVDLSCLSPSTLALLNIKDPKQYVPPAPRQDSAGGRSGRGSIPARVCGPARDEELGLLKIAERLNKAASWKPKQLGRMRRSSSSPLGIANRSTRGLERFLPRPPFNVKSNLSYPCALTQYHMTKLHHQQLHAGQSSNPHAVVIRPGMKPRSSSEELQRISVGHSSLLSGAEGQAQPQERKVIIVIPNSAKSSSKPDLVQSSNFRSIHQESVKPQATFRARSVSPFTVISTLDSKPKIHDFRSASLSPPPVTRGSGFSLMARSGQVSKRPTPAGSQTHLVYPNDSVKSTESSLESEEDVLTSTCKDLSAERSIDSQFTGSEQPGTCGTIIEEQPAGEAEGELSSESLQSLLESVPQEVLEGEENVQLVVLPAGSTEGLSEEDVVRLAQSMVREEPGPEESECQTWARGEVGGTASGDCDGVHGCGESEDESSGKHKRPGDKSCDGIHGCGEEDGCNKPKGGTSSRGTVDAENGNDNNERGNNEQSSSTSPQNGSSNEPTSHRPAGQGTGGGGGAGPDRGGDDGNGREPRDRGIRFDAQDKADDSREKSIGNEEVADDGEEEDDAESDFSAVKVKGIESSIKSCERDAHEDEVDGKLSPDVVDITDKLEDVKDHKGKQKEGESSHKSIDLSSSRSSDSNHSVASFSAAKTYLDQLSSNTGNTEADSPHLADSANPNDPCQAASGEDDREKARGELDPCEGIVSSGNISTVTVADETPTEGEEEEGVDEEGEMEIIDLSDPDRISPQGQSGAEQVSEGLALTSSGASHLNVNFAEGNGNCNTTELRSHSQSVGSDSANTSVPEQSSKLSSHIDQGGLRNTSLTGPGSLLSSTTHGSNCPTSSSDLQNMPVVEETTTNIGEKHKENEATYSSEKKRKKQTCKVFVNRQDVTDEESDYLTLDDFSYSETTTNDGDEDAETELGSAAVPPAVRVDEPSKTAFEKVPSETAEGSKVCSRNSANSAQIQSKGSPSLNLCDESKEEDIDTQGKIDCKAHAQASNSTIDVEGSTKDSEVKTPRTYQTTISECEHTGFEDGVKIETIPSASSEQNLKPRHVIFDKKNANIELDGENEVSPSSSIISPSMNKGVSNSPLVKDLGKNNECEEATDCTSVATGLHDQSKVRTDMKMLAPEVTECAASTDILSQEEWDSERLLVVKGKENCDQETPAISIGQDVSRELEEQRRDVEENSTEDGMKWKSVEEEECLKEIVEECDTDLTLVTEQNGAAVEMTEDKAGREGDEGQQQRTYEECIEDTKSHEKSLVVDGRGVKAAPNKGDRLELLSKQLVPEETGDDGLDNSAEESTGLSESPLVISGDAHELDSSPTRLAMGFHATKETNQPGQAMSIAEDNKSLLEPINTSQDLGTGNTARERMLENIKAKSLAHSGPGEEGPFKCPTCKRMYRTQASYFSHIKDCDFDVSTSDEDEGSVPVMEKRELRSSSRRKPNEADQGKILSPKGMEKGSAEMTPLPQKEINQEYESEKEAFERMRQERKGTSLSPLNEPLSIIISDEFREGSASSRDKDLSDDCSSQDSRRSSLRRSTVSQRNAAPAHLAKQRPKSSPDGSVVTSPASSALLSPKGGRSSSLAILEEKPSPKETMLEAVGLVSKRALELSPNSESGMPGAGEIEPGSSGGEQTCAVKLQPRFSPTTMAVIPKREKRSSTLAATTPGLPGAASKPSIMAGGKVSSKQEQVSPRVKSVSIVADPVVVTEVSIGPTKKPRKKRIWWVEATESSEEEDVKEMEEDPLVNVDVEGGVARRTRHSRQRLSEDGPEGKKSLKQQGKASAETLDAAAEEVLEQAKPDSENQIDASEKTDGRDEEDGTNVEDNNNSDSLTLRSSRKRQSAVDNSGEDLKVRSSNRQTGDGKVELGSPKAKKKGRMGSNDKGADEVNSVDVDSPRLRKHMSPIQKHSSPDNKKDDQSAEHSEEESDQGQDAEDERLGYTSHGEDGQKSPVRRSCRPSSKTAKLSEFLAKLKREKESLDKEKEKSELENEQQPAPQEKRGRGRPRIYPVKEKPAAGVLGEKRGRGRPRIYPRVEEKTMKDEEMQMSQSSKEGESADVGEGNKSERGSPRLLRSRTHTESSVAEIGARDDRFADENDGNITKSEEDSGCEQNIIEAEDTVRENEKKSGSQVDKKDGHHNESSSSSTMMNCTEEKSKAVTENTVTHKAEPNKDSQNLAPAIVQNNEDCSKQGQSMPKNGTDISKAPGQRLRIIVRSPNVLAAQKVGELIKKTAQSINPEVSDITLSVDDKDKKDQEAGAASKKNPLLSDGDSMKQESDSCSDKNSVSESLRGDENKVRPGLDPAKSNRAGDVGAQSGSRSVSPDSVSAAYDIQSDDFSSETSNDTEDFVPRTVTVSENRKNAEECSSVLEKLKAPLADSAKMSTDLSVVQSLGKNIIGKKISVLPVTAATNSTRLEVTDGKNTEAQHDDDDDDDEDDVVLVKAVGLQPPEPSIALGQFQGLHQTKTMQSLSKPGTPSNHLPSSHHPSILTSPREAPQHSGIQLSQQQQHSVSFITTSTVTISKGFQSPLHVISNISPQQRLMLHPEIQQQQQQHHHHHQQQSLSPPQAGLLLQNLAAQSSKAGVLLSANGSPVQTGGAAGLILPSASPSGLTLNNQAALTLQAGGQSAIPLHAVSPSGISFQTNNQPALALPTSSPQALSLQTGGQAGLRLQAATQQGGPILMGQPNPAGVVLGPSQGRHLQGLVQGSVTPTPHSGLSIISLGGAQTILSPLQALQQQQHQLSQGSLSQGLSNNSPTLLSTMSALNPLVGGRVGEASPPDPRPLIIGQPLQMTQQQQMLLTPQQQQPPQQLQYQQQQQQQKLLQQHQQRDTLAVQQHRYHFHPQQQQQHQQDLAQPSILGSQPSPLLSSQLLSPLAPQARSPGESVRQVPASQPRPATPAPTLIPTPQTRPAVSAHLPTPVPMPSAPQLTHVDGTPAQVNYMGTFDLNSSTLQAVMSGQGITQNTTQMIKDLVQRALRSGGREVIPGVEVKSAITDTPQGPKKVLRVFINEDILPIQRGPVEEESSASQVSSVCQSVPAAHQQSTALTTATAAAGHSSVQSSLSSLQQSSKFTAASNIAAVAAASLQPLRRSVAHTLPSQQEQQRAMPASSGSGTSVNWSKLLQPLQPQQFPAYQSKTLAASASVTNIPQTQEQQVHRNLKPQAVRTGSNFRRALKPAVCAPRSDQQTTGIQTAKRKQQGSGDQDSASTIKRARAIFEKTRLEDGSYSGVLGGLSFRNLQTVKPISLQPKSPVTSSHQISRETADNIPSQNVPSQTQNVQEINAAEVNAPNNPEPGFQPQSVAASPLIPKTVSELDQPQQTGPQQNQNLSIVHRQQEQQPPPHSALKDALKQMLQTQQNSNRLQQQQQQQQQRQHPLPPAQPTLSPMQRASFPNTSSGSASVKAQQSSTLTTKMRLSKHIVKKASQRKDTQRDAGPTRGATRGRGLGRKAALTRKMKIGSHHPLIHHNKKGGELLPQPTLEEEVIATPLDALSKGDHPAGGRGPQGRAGLERSQSRLRFEISSDDGFSCHGDTMEDAWNQVLEKVQDVRAACRMKQLSYAGVSGRAMSGLENSAVVYLLEQLYGAVHCHQNYKFRFHKYDLDQADAEVTINQSGSARSEAFLSRKPFDMFNFLKSVYRTRPGDEERDKEEEMSLKSSRQVRYQRATSLSLPMAMRFRKLKTFAKEAVDVYRSKIHGRGLFCKRNIDAGEMVIEYAGEVIRASLTDKREKYYEGKGIGCYMFRIDDDEVVDATMHGSAARFINHSCEPNCFSKVILVEGKKHIVIFAMRPIKRGEELTYDYKFPIEEVKIPCSCGSKRCRKYLN